MECLFSFRVAERKEQEIEEEEMMIMLKQEKTERIETLY